MQGTRERGPAAEPDTIRVVVDDHPVVRFGVRECLESRGIEVLGEGANAREALLLCEALEPDVLVLDHRLNGSPGTSCLEGIVRSCPATRVLVYTAQPGEGVVHSALSAGAHGILRKTVDPTALAQAVRRVAAGERVLDPAAQRVSRSIEAGKGPFGLTARELDVVGLAARGLRNVDIAQELFVSPDTVKTHLSAALRKLGVRDRTSAVVRALREGVIDLTTSGEAGPVNGA